ncbi:MAG: hypothetical protein Kow00107_10720 [Planctomycetota bacterium]
MFSIYATPHSIALGAAIGMFVGLTPTMGVQVVSSIALCVLVKANPVSSLGPVFITNPVTAPFIYYFNYYLGTVLLSSESVFRLSYFSAVNDENFWRKVAHVFWPLVVGSLLVALISALITYPVTYWLAVRIKKRRESKEAKWRAVISSASVKEVYPDSFGRKSTSGRLKEQNGQ